MRQINKLKMKPAFLSVPDKALATTSQTYLPIADIVDSIILYKDGGAALVLESTSLNFGLLSEGEQRAVIAGYAGLLNSFSYPIQIVVRSERKDISDYLRFLEEESLKGVANPKLANLMQSYKRFIQEAIKKKNVLSKKFYVIIPFTQYELGITKSFMAITKREEKLPFPKSYVIKKAKTALFPKRDHMIRQAGRLGLRLRQLTTPELVELCYHIFNPEPPTTKEIEPEPSTETQPGAKKKPVGKT
jgi:hypothetical protein